MLGSFSVTKYFFFKWSGLLTDCYPVIPWGQKNVKNEKIVAKIESLMKCIIHSALLTSFRILIVIEKEVIDLQTFLERKNATEKMGKRIFVARCNYIILRIARSLKFKSRKFASLCVRNRIR